MSDLLDLAAFPGNRLEALAGNRRGQHSIRINAQYRISCCRSRSASNGLARELRVPVTQMSEIVNGRRAITADTALRLARYFGMTPHFWMNLQTAYDLDVASRALADRIARDVHPREAA